MYRSLLYQYLAFKECLTVKKTMMDLTTDLQVGIYGHSGDSGIILFFAGGVFKPPGLIRDHAFYGG
jgi:hypothetical protein